MHIKIKATDDSVICVPFNEVSFNVGAKLDKKETVGYIKVSFDGLGLNEYDKVGPLTERTYYRLTQSPDLCSLNVARDNIIDMPLEKVFELYAKAKEKGLDLLDLCEQSGKRIYDKVAPAEREPQPLQEVKGFFVRKYRFTPN